MNILTAENRSLDLDLIGTDAGDTSFSVFDISKRGEEDYYFRPLVFLDSFDSAGASVQAGSFQFLIPKDWSIVAGDPETGDVELIFWEDINVRRNLHALSFNPITGGFYPEFLPLKMLDIYMDLSWIAPRLESQSFLTMPIHNGKDPRCVLIINELTQKKLPDVLTLNLIVG